MKRKTLFITVILATLTLVLSACSNKQKGPELPSASSLISQIQEQHLSSGESDQVIKIGNSDKTATAMRNHAIFGGNPEVIQLDSYMGKDNRTQKISEWINKDNAYVQVKNQWYKSPIKPLLSTDFTTLNSQIIANQVGLSFPKKVLKQMKVKDNITSYIISYKSNTGDKELANEVANNIITAAQDKEQAKTFSDALKNAEYKGFQIQATINKKDKKLVNMYITANLLVNGTTKMTVQQVYDKIGSYDMNAIPSDVTSKAKDIQELVKQQNK